jgi:hypothetical protein
MCHLIISSHLDQNQIRGARPADALLLSGNKSKQKCLPLHGACGCGFGWELTCFGVKGGGRAFFERNGAVKRPWPSVCCAYGRDEANGGCNLKT